MKDLQNWWQLTAIQIGGAVCLPVIVVGHTLSQHYGFLSAIIAIIIGNAVLLAMSLPYAKMSYGNKKTTIENAEEYFGARGIRIFSLAMIISLTSWFAIQLNMMSISVLDLLAINNDKQFWLLFLNLILGFVTTFATLYGIRGVSFLANFSLPFFLITLGYAVWTVEPITASPVSKSISFGGVSLVIALAIALVVDMPTYYRFARTLKDGKISVGLLFMLIIPLLEICGVYITSGASGENILEVLKKQDSIFWNMWVASFLILAGWTTNNLNLYSGAICLQSIFKEFSEKKSMLAIGVAGSVLSCFDLLNHIELTLDIIGISVAAMGAVVLIRYVSKEYTRWEMFTEDNYLENLMSWAFGIIIGFLSLLGYGFTSIAMVDAVIGACLGVLLAMNFKELYEKV
jgi:cytosine permease